jgi:hypothetical protein
LEDPKVGLPTHLQIGGISGKTGLLEQSRLEIRIPDHNQLGFLLTISLGSV